MFPGAEGAHQAGNLDPASRGSAQASNCWRSGKELIGLCPFHQDRNPSLNIDPVKSVSGTAKAHVAKAAA